MRATGKSTQLKAAAYAGTYVVVLAWDTLDGKAPARKNLLGYAIERAELDTAGNEVERYWLRGIKRFKDKTKDCRPAPRFPRPSIPSRVFSGPTTRPTRAHVTCFELFPCTAK